MRLTIQDLERETGITRRTIHYWAHEGLLPSPRGAGPSATYGEEHLVRLQLIPLLKRAGLRLDRICRALDGLRVKEMHRLLEAAPRSGLDDPHRVAAWLHAGRDGVDALPGPVPARASSGPPEGCRRWLRHEIRPGLEVHFCAERAGVDAGFEVKLRRLDDLLTELFENFGGDGTA